MNELEYWKKRCELAEAFKGVGVEPAEVKSKLRPYQKASAEEMSSQFEERITPVKVPKLGPGNFVCTKCGRMFTLKATNTIKKGFKILCACGEIASLKGDE